jgi:hypothetical protein
MEYANNLIYYFVIRKKKILNYYHLVIIIDRDNFDLIKNTLKNCLYI